MAEQRHEPEEGGSETSTPWFRDPDRREHRIAGGLFIGFGVFFVLLFFVLVGWWFRWVILGLGVYSCLVGIRHARNVRS